MSSLCICGADFSGIERNPYCQIHGENGTKSKPVSLNCDADHCTPEERAVIEAAVRDHESETHPEGESRNVGFDRMVQARREFRLAVTELLAARARKGEVE